MPLVKSARQSSQLDRWVRFQTGTVSSVGGHLGNRFVKYRRCEESGDHGDSGWAAWDSTDRPSPQAWKDLQSIWSGNRLCGPAESLLATFVPAQFGSGSGWISQDRYWHSAFSSVCDGSSYRHRDMDGFGGNTSEIGKTIRCVSSLEGIICSVWSVPTMKLSKWSWKFGCTK